MSHVCWQRGIGRNGTQSIDEWPTLEALLAEQSDLLALPAEVIPRIAWLGRHALFAGLAKLGKTTLIGQGAAAVTTGAPFLDGQAMSGRVIWVGVDEYLGDTALRFQRFGADPARIRILHGGSPGLMDSLQRILDHEEAEHPGELLLVVVDSLIEWARLTRKDGAPDDADTAGWAQVVRPLTALAHDRNIAVNTIHHGRRSDGRYRSSGEIAAAVDVIYDMLQPRQREDATVRRLEGVGRFHVGRWTCRLVDGSYEFGSHVEGQDQDPIDRLHWRLRRTLDALPGGGATWSQWRAESECAQSTFGDHVKKLRGMNLIKQTEDGRYERVTPDTPEHFGTGVAGAPDSTPDPPRPRRGRSPESGPELE